MVNVPFTVLVEWTYSRMTTEFKPVALAVVRAGLAAEALASR